jgi:hypothetical protein
MKSNQEQWKKQIEEAKNESRRKAQETAKEERIAELEEQVSARRFISSFVSIFLCVDVSF